MNAFVWADVVFSTEGIALIGGLMLPLSGAIWFLFNTVKSGYDLRIAAKDAETASWKEIAKEANERLEQVTEREFSSRGASRVPPLAAVVPEHSSPTSPEQQAIADIATERAKLVALTLALDLPPRVASPPAEGATGTSMKSDIAKIKGDVAETKGDVKDLKEIMTESAE